MRMLPKAWGTTLQRLAAYIHNTKLAGCSKMLCCTCDTLCAHRTTAQATHHIIIISSSCRSCVQVEVVHQVPQLSPVLHPLCEVGRGAAQLLRALPLHQVAPAGEQQQQQARVLGSAGRKLLYINC